MPSPEHLHLGVRLARLVGRLDACSADDGTALLRGAVRAAGDLRCARRSARGPPRPSLGTRRTRALAAFRGLLKDTETTYLETEIVIHYWVKQHQGLASSAPLFDCSAGLACGAQMLWVRAG